MSKSTLAILAFAFAAVAAVVVLCALQSSWEREQRAADRIEFLKQIIADYRKALEQNQIAAGEQSLEGVHRSMMEMVEHNAQRDPALRKRIEAAKEQQAAEAKVRADPDAFFKQ